MLMIKGYIKGLPKMLVWTIVRAAASFLIVLIIHTWLVIYKNEGFAPDPNNPVYRLIAFASTKAGSLAFWSITAFILSSLAGRIFFSGFKKLFADLASTPNWIITSFQKAGNSAIPALLSGVMLAAVSSFIIKSNYLMLTLAIGILLSYTSGEQGMWFLFLSTAWSDFKRLFMKDKAIKHGPVSVLIFGLMLGMFIAAALYSLLWARIILVVLGVAGFVLLFRKKKITPRTLVWLGFFIFLQALIWKAAGVLADDGGWAEAGGSFWSWWNSPGRSTAIGMGVPPGLASLLGALLGGGGVPKPPPIPEVMDYNVSGWKWVQENGKWVLYQADETGQTYGKGLPQSIFEADPEGFGNLVQIYTQPTCSNDAAVDKVNNALSNYGNAYTDNFTMQGWQSMNNADKEASMRNLSRLVAEAAGVDPNTITFRLFSDPSTGLNGQFLPNSRVIELNTNSDNFNNPLKMIQTLAHEMRHAAQSDPKAELGGDKNYRDLISWNDKNENYQGADTDFTRYSGQLLERDADSFGRDVSRAIIQQVIKNKVGL